MIPQKNISLISNKSHLDGGRRIPETVIERDYCLAWFLFGLSQSLLREPLIFKGGTALRRCHFADYRFSEDLDFTLVDEIPLEKVLEEFSAIFSWVKGETGIEFAHVRQEESSENTHTFYISYVGPLPGKAKEVKVDVTFRELLIHPVEIKEIIKTHEEYFDFLEGPTIKVYSLNEVAIEKTCALFTPARNEPRDLYDIHYLIREEGVDMTQLIHDIDEKLKFKDSSFEERRDEFFKKEKRLQKLWNKRLSTQMSRLPEYNGIFRAVKRVYRQAGLIQ